MPPNKLKEADVTVCPPDVRTPFRIKLPEVILFEPKFANAEDDPIRRPTMKRAIKDERFKQLQPPKFVDWHKSMYQYWNRLLERRTNK